MYAFFQGMVHYLIYGIMASVGIILNVWGWGFISGGMLIEKQNEGLTYAATSSGMPMIIGGGLLCFVAGYIAIFAIIKLGFKLVALFIAESPIYTSGESIGTESPLSNLKPLSKLKEDNKKEEIVFKNKFEG